ncbi:MAG TPA: V4R domain-containing protein [Longimicrobiaceae bacterium]|nr:V4R domain-containing protein [Longimicrobiaceae bacterium]
MTDTLTRAPMLQFPTSILPALRRALGREHSPADAAALERQLGFETGEGFYAALRNRLEDSGADVDTLPADEFWQRVGDFFADLGWGTLEFDRLHPGVAALSSADWVEADPNVQAAQPSCHFTTGLLADLLGRVAGDDLAVLEVECRCAGDDRCRFLLGGGDALERVFDAMRQGRSYREAVEQLG